MSSSTRITEREIRHAIDAVYADHVTGTRIRKGELVNAIFHKITANTSVVMTRVIEEKIHQSIREQIALGNLVDIRGLNGGIALCDYAQTSPRGWQSYAARMDEKVKAQKAASNTIAVNDHICPTCGNDRVSKCEKSCWKCGGLLH